MLRDAYFYVDAEQAKILKTQTANVCSSSLVLLEYATYKGLKITEKKKRQYL